MQKSSLVKRDSSRKTLKRILGASKKPESCDKAELESYLQLLADAWNQFCHAQDEVELACGSETLQEQEAEREQGEEWYRQAWANYKRAMNELEKTQNNTQQQTACSSKAQARVDLKLPTIPLPQFSGDPKEWRSFSDAFESMIHGETSLNGSQKLHYLRCSLHEEALQVIKGFPLTDKNYEEAWKLLKKRYDVQRIIIDSHFRALFALKTINVESSTALKTLLDATQEHYQSLKALGRPVTNWDDWLVHLTVSKLDVETHRQWELSQTNVDVASFDMLVSFIETRCRSLDAINSHHQPVPSKSKQQPRSKPTFIASSSYTVTPSEQRHQRSTNNQDTCIYCSSRHKVYICDKFRSLDVSGRAAFVWQRKLCTNCLAAGHNIDDCRSNNSCRVCQARHHTLLHQTTTVSASPSTPFMQSHLTHAHHQVLLGTAIVKVVDVTGRYQPARLLVDNGSHMSFICESLSQRLDLKRSSISTAVEGIGGTPAGKSKGEVELIVSSIDHSFLTSIRAQILPKITNDLPPIKLNTIDWPHIRRLKLADPHFHTPAAVDILLGSDELGQFLRIGLVTGPIGTPIAQQSTLGWILFGKVIDSMPVRTAITATCLHTDRSLTKAVSRFWEIESLPEVKHLSPEEQQCEKHFADNHYRDGDGRYVVKLPFKPDCPLGSSRHAAVRALYRLEACFAKNEQLGLQYKDFIHEFRQLGHMEKVSHAPTVGKHYYMPHRAVIKETSTTTKLRVVFNASCRTTTGFSLNDTQMIGPRLQADLFDALIRLRSYRFAMSADVAKMYRQVRVDEEHLDYQRIVWRDTPCNEVEDYRIVTVTYGVASSSHLAVKCIQQTALDEGKDYPEAAQVILHHFYMDDLLTGCFEEADLHRLQAEVSTILNRGGFCLRKWSTNSPLVLNAVPDDQREILRFLDVSEEDSVRTLGLQWEPSIDNLGFAVQVSESRTTNLTKRLLLSEASKLFDPLGLLSPSTIISKMLFQSLWNPKVDWDEAVPDDVKRQWFNYRDHITSLAAIKVPRYITVCLCCCRTISPNDDISVQLLTAKTRVAPLKLTTLSLPRLELCGAALLAQLIKHVMPILEGHIRSVYGWSDSTIALSWIREHPGKWCTFVSNRVSQIQQTVPAKNWFHVQSSQNPADCATRGVLPHRLADHPLWWNGPHWLAQHESSWPQQQIFTTNLDQRPETVYVASSPQAPPSIWDIIDRYSSLRKLKRVTAYILRFLNNTRATLKRRDGISCPAICTIHHLHLYELNEALLLWVRLTQKSYFATDIHNLKSNKPLSRNSKLLRMCPFLDEKGLLRVGGRLNNAPLLPDKKFPLLLPGSARITTLICEDIHRITLHTGPQAMQATLQSRFWAIGARNILRKIYRMCVKCRRHSRTLQQQLMGNLPSFRVVSCRPFQRSGVDFAGPIQLRLSKGRGSKAVKGYISVFICMATGAMHLELASDLSSSTFIAVFKRFVSRRGHCKELFSDNGTNFIGAEKELRKLLSQAIKDQAVANYFADDGTLWHFNLPASPHMGGYWESAVKRVKYHIRRTLGDNLLTFEEYSTLLAEIEACVNSRPLCALSSDVNDFLVLTPGHFLIGESLKTIPEPDLVDYKGTLLNRWQFITSLRQHFWRRWSAEYLVQLQQRSKWNHSSTNLNIGDLVVIRDERLPPTKWKLGRVAVVHPGADRKVRVVTLKTADGLLTRPIVKLAPLLNI